MWGLVGSLRSLRAMQGVTEPHVAEGMTLKGLKDSGLFLSVLLPGKIDSFAVMCALPQTQSNRAR